MLKIKAKIKSGLLLIVSLCICMQMSVSAVTAEVKFDEATRRVTVTGYTKTEQAQSLAFVVLKPDSEPIADDSTAERAILFADAGVSNDDGSYCFEFTMDDANPSGWYQVKVQSFSEGSNAQGNGRYYFLNTQKEKQIIGEFNSADADAVDSLLNKYSSTDEPVLNIKRDDFYLRYKAEVGQALVNMRGTGFKTLENIVTAFAQARVIVIINNSDETNIYDNITSNAEDIGIALNDDWKTYKKEITNALIKQKEISGGFAAPKEIKRIIYENLMLLTANLTNDTKVLANAIKTYSEVLDIDMDEYNKYSEYEITKVLVGRGDYTDLNAFVAAVENQLKSLSDSSNGKSDTGNGGSGSRGGSGSSGKAFVYPVTEDTLNNTASGAIFADVPAEHWAHPAISGLKEMKVVSGYGDNYFGPDDTVTREQFVKMLICAMNLRKDGAVSTFADVDASQWYSEYIAAAQELGIVEGKEGNLFGIGDNITRQDMAVLIYRTAEIANITLAENTEYKAFADDSEIASYAKGAVKTLQMAGIVNGVTQDTFAPNEYCTRAQAAKIIYGLLQNRGE